MTTTDDNNIVGKHIEFIIDTADEPFSVDCIVDCIVAEYDAELGLSIVEAEDHTRYRFCFRTTYVTLKRKPNNIGHIVIGHIVQEESVQWLAELMEEVNQGYLKLSTVLRLEDKYNQPKRIFRQKPSANTCAFV